MNEYPIVTNQRAHTGNIRILQINLNKSEKAHLELINSNLSDKYEIILIQEPHVISKFNGVRSPSNFRPVFPSFRTQSPDTIRSVIWVNRKIDTSNWIALDIPNTNDITAIQLKNAIGVISIFNIYNDCSHSRNENILNSFLINNRNNLLASERHHMIWAGDFNRHHPMWDNDNDIHLFTPQAIGQAENLIELIANYDLHMALPKGIPTLQHMVTKKYSRPDNFFTSLRLLELITLCEVDPAARPPTTDHLPIITKIQIPQQKASTLTTFNFRDVNWPAFRSNLRKKLNRSPTPHQFQNPEQITTALNSLTSSIQSTIQEIVPLSKPHPDTKRWWTPQLKNMRKKLNRLRNLSFQYRAIANHPAHSKLKRDSNTYSEAIIRTKRNHWENFLNELSSADIWTANKFLNNPPGDGGLPRIPSLKTTNPTGNIISTDNNEGKATIFAKTFFPPPPPPQVNPILTQQHDNYPEPYPDPPTITKEQVSAHIKKLPSHKAPGPDGIPNVVLKECSDLLLTPLTNTFNAILALDTYYDPWREFTTVVLRKPGKPNYETPKAYRPIALISNLAKLLTAIIAENLSNIVELHQILPKNHFGGRPGRTTTDAIHYLTNKIHTAWRNNKVASVLFLDVEGAFPNAVTTRLIENLKKRRIPQSIVKFIQQLLTNRRTRLKFDDYISDPIPIQNGIGQGDPLSMILYILYNADLLDIPDNQENEDALGYVDDIALITIGDNLEETTNRLSNIMTKNDGALQWSRLHNSKFEANKSAIMHFSRKTILDPTTNTRVPIPRPELKIQGQLIEETLNYKYLGILFDNQLNWKAQAQRATANATKWILQFHRLTRPSTGVKLKLMRQLYISVALPKITYGIDAWYTPPNKQENQNRNTGSVTILRNLQKVQRIAVLAITGTLRSSPNDFIDAHANLLPLDLALTKACHNAVIRYHTLLESNPIHGILKEYRLRAPTTHLSPLFKLLKLFQTSNLRIETINTNLNPTLERTRFNSHIDDSRKSSISNKAKDPADFKIYADGSCQNNGIGAAAILFKKDSIRPLNSLQLFLGPSTDHNTFEAEICGAILALWLTENTPDTIGKKVSLYIDNQAVIKSLNTPTFTSGQHLIQALKHAANRSATQLTIKWISSHSNVLGNEEADRLAKKAAEGRSSAIANLPHIFRNPIPISASATKQAHNALLQHKWTETWNHSPRRIRLEQLGEPFPFKKTYQTLTKLPRSQTSTILQIRCGHFPLNQYLHRINKTDSNTCRPCHNANAINPPPETITHFLFDCPAYAQQRIELATKIGHQHLNLPDIMSNPDHLKALLKYIRKTKRLQNPAQQQ